ncbi:hypothetical protein [Roseateles amylovorans]|uniref:Type IV pilus biogenesis protein PilP n=1 Tax=Roseateles amylovorans TaxID=2978473 RepID=A0ABY6B505_9BURK|nr:hypothetical protein [Roseateles amylovorans]UXH80275.1 hypothetical protein N4261_10535 [Roseateles amylovorans]
MAVGAILLIGPGVSIAQTEPASGTQYEPASASMQQVIDAARRKKAAELDAAARRMLGTDAVQPPVVAPPAPPAEDGAHRPSAPSAEELPQIWSLSGVDKRLHAEIYFGGQIYHVDSKRSSNDAIGPWQVQSIQDDGVTLSLRHDVRRAKRLPQTLTLAPPQRGTPVSNYPFPSAAGSALSGATLPASALRAAQLPFDGNGLATNGRSSP